MIAGSGFASARSLFGLFGLVILTGCSSATHNPVFDSYPSSVSGHTTVVYYDVEGNTFRELATSMRRLGPRVAGTSFVGETRSPMRWTWRTESIGSTECSIRDVTVSVNAQVTLPRWNAPEDADPALVAEWRRFLLALETHESGHKDISAKAARDIVNRLRGMTASCSQLGSRANEIAMSIVDKAAQEQIVYDAVTRHGLTQGTTFRSPSASR